MTPPSPPAGPAPLDRRQFLVAATAALAAAATRGVAGAETPAGPRPAGPGNLFASVGPELVNYAVDVAAATLARRSSVTLPAGIQYAWPHPRQAILYVACSNQAGAFAGDVHLLGAFGCEPATGRLAALGAPRRLRYRPVNITVDPAGGFLLTAYPHPSGLTVHRLGADGALGPEVPPDGGRDWGSYAHQVRVTPSGRRAVLVTRGNDPTPAKPEDPGALKVFEFAAGRLGRELSVAPHGGLGFGPRHLDFHPTRPWAFVSQERENVLSVFDLEAPVPSPLPLFSTGTLGPAPIPGAGQAASAVHVHPRGHVVYVMNRATGTVDFGGEKVFAGGENTIAVFALDPATGEPRLVQSVETDGWSARTFSIDPSGRLLVAANQSGFLVRRGDRTARVPASLALFRIAADGTLTPVRREPVDVSQGPLFWNGFAPPGWSGLT